MIKILAHRQNNLNPKVTILADGIEVDIWATPTGIVLGHDAADQGLNIKEIISVFTDKTIALNAKSDDLANRLSYILTEDINYFIFDASVPESLKLLSKGLKVFTRQSEYEKFPSFYDHAHGVWMDQMKDDWVNGMSISNHLQKRKEVCVVSPELHGRPFEESWRKLKDTAWDLDFYICTKFPERAKIFFNGKD